MSKYLIDILQSLSIIIVALALFLHIVSGH